MKQAVLVTVALLAGLVFGCTVVWAQAENGNGVCAFLDEDGDGFNDLAPDDDGDGIPNRLDPDYAPPEDGSGNQYGWGRYACLFQAMFGDGVMNQGPAELDPSFGSSSELGLGEGPGDHTGFGPGSGDGTGDGVDVGGRAQRRGSQG